MKNFFILILIILSLGSESPILLSKEIHESDTGEEVVWHWMCPFCGCYNPYYQQYCGNVNCVTRQFSPPWVRLNIDVDITTLQPD